MSLITAVLRSQVCSHPMVRRWQVLLASTSGSQPFRLWLLYSRANYRGLHKLFVRLGDTFQFLPHSKLKTGTFEVYIY